MYFTDNGRKWQLIVTQEPWDFIDFCKLNLLCGLVSAVQSGCVYNRCCWAAGGWQRMWRHCQCKSTTAAKEDTRQCQVQTWPVETVHRVWYVTFEN